MAAGPVPYTADMGEAPAPAADAGSVVLVRPAPDPGGRLQVLLLERPASAHFAPSALVFPGGSVHAADADRGWRALVAGTPSPDPRAPLSLAVAAIRECFEETGVLLVQGPDGRPPGPTVLAGLEPTRERLRDGDAFAFRPALEGAGLRLALDPFPLVGHWITPRELPRRFDTRFFLADLPAGQAPVPDHRGEHVSQRWLTPAAALADGRVGTTQLLPPTRAVLEGLLEAETVAAALAAAASRVVVSECPRLDDLTPERFPGLDLGRVHPELQR